MDNPSLVAAVVAAESRAKARDKADRAAVELPVDALKSVMLRLRDEPSLQFDMLVDHTAIDWLAEGQFEMVYQLYSTTHRHHLMVSTRISRTEPVVPTLMSVWSIAEFQEREVYDMFGVLYEGHSDLRRLFLEDDWKGFPLRKDYQDDFMVERPQ